MVRSQKEGMAEVVSNKMQEQMSSRVSEYTGMSRRIIIYVK
jgi:hypothetical protein